jgi:tetratricopeptide (TPR) repeat protein
MNDTSTFVAELAALDRGAYRDAIARYHASEPTNDPAETMWRAEIALYLDRLEDAQAELERVEERLEDDLAIRAEIVRAEIAFADKALDEAAQIVTPLIHSTWERGSEHLHLRASLLFGRVALRRAESREALERLEEPRRLAALQHNAYYAGIVAYCRAFALYNLGDFKRAGRAFDEALPLLTGSEGLRWESMCRTLYGGFLADFGRYEEALAEYDRSETLAAEIGSIADILWARNNAANTLIVLGRHEEAIERLRDVLSWERQTRHIFAENIAQRLLAQAFAELGRYDEARSVAEEAIQLAEIAGSRVHVLDGRLILNWAAGLAGDASAVEELRDLITQCDAEDSDYHKAEARLLLAETLVSGQPDVAWGLCAEARKLSVTEESGRLHQLVLRIEGKLTGNPIRVGAHGELVFDLRCGVPDFDVAVEALKRHLVYEAVRSSGGNRAEAARKLNLTRSRLHDIWLQLHGKPVRPQRLDVA